jgi:hypothetical protein
VSSGRKTDASGDQGMSVAEVAGIRRLRGDSVLTAAG